MSMETEEETMCLCVYYHDENLNRHINTGMTYPVSFFTSGITETEVEIPSFKEEVTSLEIDQYALYVEALEWFDFDMDEVSSMSFKAKQMSIQQGMKQYGESGKKSALKETEN